MPLESLGDLTAARARDEDELIELLAALTKLTPRTVRGRLRDANGKTLVRNVLVDDWPNAPDTLGEVRVKLAREVGLVEEIAELTGLRRRTIRSRLESAHGSSLLATTFEDRWPDGEDSDVDENDDFEEEQDDEEDDEDDGVVAVEEGSDGEEDAVDRDASALLRLDPEGSWSRPRQLAGVFDALGEEIPERLRTVRFQRLVALLDGLGVEIRPADQPEPFSLDAESPGMGARVCLRIKAGEKESLQPRRVESRLSPQPRDSRPQSPPIVVLTPSSTVAPSPTPPPPPDSHWGLALERLQFLTAVPSMERQRDSDWPVDYVNAAIEGLSLTAEEKDLLGRLAAGWVRGNHSPFPLIRSLVALQIHHDLDGLIGHFRRLNRGMEDAVEMIVRSIEERRGLNRTAPPASAPPHADPERAMQQTAAPLAPSSVNEYAPPRATAAPAPREKAKSNTRSLGALDDLFNDKE